LRPGQPLQQREIASRLAVSPTPVREAFRRLETVGLLVANSHSGFRVAEPLHPTDATTDRIKAELERIGIDLVIQRVTDDDVAELRAINASYRIAADSEARDLHWRLHLRIFETADLPVLVIMLRALWNLLDMGIARPPDRERSFEHHGLIIDAIAARDAEAAKRLIDEHHDRRHSR
jgi:DNA-binding GntR family transcriptional regulator